MSAQARLVKKGSELHVYTPYHRLLVEQIRGIPGRRWDGTCWIVPVRAEEQTRELVRQFYQIEGEPCYVPFVVLRVHIRSEKKGYACGQVSVDDCELFLPESGYLNMQEEDGFVILDYAGGFTDEYKSARSRKNGFVIDYTLKIKVRDGAKWVTSGAASYEILSGGTAIDQFLEQVAEDL